MADERTLGFGEEESLLRKILSPAEAQSLVKPPPDHPPLSGPAESTPLTGNLCRPPSQATPARSPAYEQKPATRQGLTGYFASASAPDRSDDGQYIKISSNGQIGYLPRANLSAALEIDKHLKVLD